jgi:hypothetical protein
MAGYDPAKVRYLREFYTTAEIRGFWKQLGDTDRDYATNPIQINAHAQDGESSSGIVVRTAEEAAVWIATAERAYLEAKAAEEGGATPGALPDNLSRGTDFSQRMVRA